MRPFVPNAEQEAAILSRAGELCVRAGAGSGKTAVIAERFAEAVLTDGIAPDSILAITFTEKAATELLERMRTALSARDPAAARLVARAWISTIHGFCARVLRRHPLEAGLDPGFAVADRLTAEKLKREAFATSLSACISSHDDVRELVAAFGARNVRDSTLVLFGRLRSSGRGASEIAQDDAPDVESASARFGRRLECYSAELASLVAPGKSLPRLKALVAETLRRVEALQRRCTPDALPAELAAILAEFKPSHHNSERLKPVVESMRGEKDQLLSLCVEALEQKHAAALSRLLSGFSAEYERLKREGCIADFDDLQMLTRDLFRRQPTLASDYRRQFRLIMIDEFQDTDQLQIDVLSQITDGNLCTVGDEQQSIYGFRNADVDLFRAKTAEMIRNGAGDETLFENYRSDGEVLGFVNELFGSPGFFADFIRLQACTRSPGGEPGSLAIPRVQAILVDKAGWPDGDWRWAEARALAERMAEILQGGAEPGDVVLLLRSMQDSHRYAEAIAKRGIPVVVESSGAFLASPEVAALRALLGVIVNAQDDEAVLRFLAGGMVRLSADALVLARRSTPSGGSLWQGLIAAADALPSWDSEKARSARAAVERLRGCQGRLTVDELLAEGVAAFEFDAYLAAASTGGQRALANVAKLVRLARSSGCPQHDVRAFLEYLELKEDLNDREAPAPAEDGARAVRIMSVHAAKGLEFPVVFVGDLGHDVARSGPRVMLADENGTCRIAVRLPALSGMDSGERRSTRFAAAESKYLRRDREESQRVCYVAFTRAREGLVLSGSTDLDKPSRGETLVDQVRAALLNGSGEPVAATDELVAFGGTTVRLTRIGSEHEFPVDAVRLSPAVQPVPETAPAPPAPQNRATPGLRPVRVSFSDMRAFLACPLRYHAERRLGMRGVPSQGRDDPLAFGSAVHAALQLSIGGEIPSPARLDALAKQNLLGAGARGRLERAVAAFLSSSVAERLVGYELRRELPFALDVGRSLLVGTMDLIGERAGHAIVVDYKTGRPDGATDRGPRHSAYAMQARCYALAALRRGAPDAEVVFVSLEADDPNTPAFAEKYTADDADAIVAEVNAVAQRVALGDTRPLKAYDGMVCRGCPALGGLCPIDPPRRAAQAGRRRH